MPKATRPLTGDHLGNLDKPVPPHKEEEQRRVSPEVSLSA